MDEENPLLVILLLSCVAFGTLLGYGVGHSQGFVETNIHWQEEMVRRGYAEHDAKTGEWKWIDGKESLETNKE